MSNLSLPLLASLTPKSTTPLIRQTLVQCHAEYILRRFLVRHVLPHLARKRASKKEDTKADDVPAPAAAAVESLITNSAGIKRAAPTAQSHFLLQGLLSDNATIRKRVSLMLLNAVHDDTDTNEAQASDLKKGEEPPQEPPNSRNKLNYKAMLQQVLWDVIRDEMEAFLHHGRDSGGGGGGPALIPMFGILSHFVCDDTDGIQVLDYLQKSQDKELFQTYEAAQAATKDETEKASKNSDKTKTPRAQDCTSAAPGSDIKSPDLALLRFIVQGQGLKWISCTILRLLALLLHQDGNRLTYNSAPSSAPESPRHPDSTRKTKDMDVDNDDEDDNDDDEHANPLSSILPLSSPSVFKPRHYFNPSGRPTGYEAGGPVVLSEEALSQSIQIRLTLLVDLLMRVSYYSNLQGINYPKGFMEEIYKSKEQETNESIKQEIPRKQKRRMLDGARLTSRSDSLGSFLASTLASVSSRNRSVSEAFSSSRGNNGGETTSIPSGKGDSSQLTGTSLVKLQELVEQTRVKGRREVLSKVYHLLWSSIDPCIHAGADRIGSKDMQHSYSALSPLACLIAAHKVLQCGYAKALATTQRESSPVVHLSSGGNVIISSSPVTSNSGGVSNLSDEGPNSCHDYPLLPSSVKGMERIIGILEKLVDPEGSVIIHAATYPKPTKKSKGSSGSSKGGGGSSDDGAGRNSFARIRKKKRSKSFSTQVQELMQAKKRRRTSSGSKRGESDPPSSDLASATQAILRASTVGDRVNALTSAASAALCSEKDGDKDGDDEMDHDAGLEEAMTRSLAETISLFERSTERNEVNFDTDAVDVDMKDIENAPNEEEHEDGECHEHEEADNDEDDEEEEENVEEQENEEEHADEEEHDIEGDDEEVEVAEEDDEEIDSDEDNKEFESMVVDDVMGVEDILVDDGGNQCDEDMLFMQRVRRGRRHTRPIRAVSTNAMGGSGSGPSATEGVDENIKDSRRKAYIRAGIEVLEAQHPLTHQSQIQAQFSREQTDPTACQTPIVDPPLLTPAAEQSLIQSICEIVKPPAKPLDLEVLMRRAPTQEEFFRGNISTNPLPISELKVEASGEDAEPCIKDLRQHIAKECHMADSAELIEILVANKILDLKLKLRVVFQMVWKTHLMENGSSMSESGFRHFMSSEGGSLSRERVNEETPVSELPPMIVTYRLAGIDGEATEDIVEEGDVVDPEAPPDINTSSEEYERQMEKEYGITRMITKGRGVGILLRSIQAHIAGILQRIRRDDVGRATKSLGKIMVMRKNPSRAIFLKSPPCPAITLLKYCVKITDNRKKLVNAKAPTLLLSMLLDVLNSIDDSLPSIKKNSSQSEEIIAPSPNSGPRNRQDPIGNNPTADALQELIEILSSDICGNSEKISNMNEIDESEVSSEDNDWGGSALPLTLTSLRNTSLSPHLRMVIAKLLPFLTYGQTAQSKALASQFVSYVDIDKLGDYDSNSQQSEGNDIAVLMDTFVQTAIHLPPDAVCDSLRVEIVEQGFLNSVIRFILRDIPSRPPPWSPALFEKGETNDKDLGVREWRAYYERCGLQIAFRILSGLCKGHAFTQCAIAKANHEDISTSVSLLCSCHWIESTSDNSTDEVSTNGLGILAETLLDDVAEDNEETQKLVSSLRKNTRDRKKQLAEERRNKALGDIAFSSLSGKAKIAAAKDGKEPKESLFAALTNALSGKKKPSDKAESEKPAWLREMEEMEDETGITCSICQEGRTLMPSELLGLYSYVKKVSIPSNKGGSRPSVDGTLLFFSLPSCLPASLRDSEVCEKWFKPARSAADALKGTSYGAALSISSSEGSSRTSCYITTVTAGNPIHISCHSKAKIADRNHPKAPKSEWEGATLRNSRVNCNIIMPLVSPKNSSVSVMSVESAFSTYQNNLANMLGSKPKSMLWTALHDVRLLLLRVSHGESLSIDCGGGSLSSNSALVYYILFMADMFARDAEHDAPETVHHARQLSSAFLAASAILEASDHRDNEGKKKMRKYFADSAPLAAISCILFFNTMNEDAFASTKPSGASGEEDIHVPAPKRRWELYKDIFLSGLIQCAGRRHALGITGSGCESSRGSSGKRLRSSSFTEWDDAGTTTSALSMRRLLLKRSHSNMSIDDYAKALRPMITLYAILDQLSKEFAPNMDDEAMDECAQRLVTAVETCLGAENIQVLMEKAKINMETSKILEEIVTGIKTV